MQITNNLVNGSNYQLNHRIKQQNASSPAFGMKVYTKELYESSLIKQLRQIALKDEYRFDVDGDSGKKIVKEWGSSAIIPGGSIFDKYMDTVNELAKINDGKELFVFFGKKMPFIGKDSNKNSLTMILRDTKTEKQIASEIVAPKTTEFNNIFDSELIKLQENIKTQGKKGTNKKYFDNIAPRVTVLVEGDQKFIKMKSLSNFIKKGLNLPENEKIFVSITPKHTIIQLTDEFSNYKTVNSWKAIDNNDNEYIKHLADEIKICQNNNRKLINEQSQNSQVESFLRSTDPSQAV